jgi:DHA1 family tetracycline resistance protein-like MFS transporter
MAFEWKRANPVGSLNLLRSQRQLLGLATIDFIVNVAHQVLPSVFVLYAAYRYGWDETTVGLTLAFVGICSAIVQGLIVGPAVTWLGPRRALIAGLLFGSLGMVIYGLAPSGPWFWLGVPVMSLWGITGPTIMDMMSRKVSPSEQGQLQGANSSSRSVTGLLGPAIFTATFAWLIHWLPGAPFLLAALLLVAAAAVAWVVTAPTPGADRSP